MIARTPWQVWCRCQLDTLTSRQVNTTVMRAGQHNRAAGKILKMKNIEIVPKGYRVYRSGALDASE